MYANKQFANRNLSSHSESLCTSLTLHNNNNENDERNNNNIELLFDSFGFLQPDNQQGNR